MTKEGKIKYFGVLIAGILLLAYFYFYGHWDLEKVAVGAFVGALYGLAMPFISKFTKKMILGLLNI